MKESMSAQRQTPHGSDHTLSKRGKPRVLMIIQTFRPIVGGAEMQLERLAPFLAQRGADVTILTRSRPNAPTREAIPGARVLRLPSTGGRVLASLSFTTLSIAYAVRFRRHIDVIHAHGLFSPTTAAVVATMLTGLPAIVKLLRTDEPDRLRRAPGGRLRLRLVKCYLRAFIAISSEVRTLLEQLGVPAQRIVDVPSGVDTDSFAPAAFEERQALRGQLGLPSAELVGLYVGRLDPVKNVDLLLQAWQRVRNGSLIILGDGSARQELEALSAQLGLNATVRFVGASSKVCDYMRSADWFVQPSSLEGLSSSMLEAMASGLPGVITRVSGAVDVVQDDSNGLLIEPNSVDSLTEAITLLVTSPELRTRLGAAARSTIKNQYSLAHAAERLVDLYRLLGRSRPAQT